MLRKGAKAEVSQPPTTTDSDTKRQAAQQMDKPLLLINIAECLPILSGEIIQDSDEGEPYEVLIRRIRVLHANIVEMANLAKETKYFHLPKNRRKYR